MIGLVTAIVVVAFGLPRLLTTLGLHPHYEVPDLDLSGKRALIIATSHEVLGGIKENFSFTDSDGGIDLDELTRILEIPTPRCSSSLPSQETVAPVIGSSGSTARPGCG